MFCRPLPYHLGTAPYRRMEEASRLRGSSVENLERETGVEPATSTLARSRSTTELLPLGESDYKQRNNVAAMTPDRDRCGGQCPRSCRCQHGRACPEQSRRDSRAHIEPNTLGHCPPLAWLRWPLP